jgi:hypothetical protein
MIDLSRTTICILYVTIQLENQLFFSSDLRAAGNGRVIGDQKSACRVALHCHARTLVSSAVAFTEGEGIGVGSGISLNEVK